MEGNGRSDKGVSLPFEQLTDLARLTELELVPAVARGDLGFMAWEFAHFNLPYRDPGKVIAWTRRNGAFTVSVRPAALRSPVGETEYVVPSGKVPRAALLWMCTEAKRTGSPELHLGDSANAFLRRLGFEIGGVQSKALHRQLRALFGATVEVSQVEQLGEVWRDRQGAFPVSQSYQLYFSSKTGEMVSQEGLFDSTVTISDRLFLSIIEHGIPVDAGAWRWINERTKSPMALDLYVFLSSRLYTLKKPTLLPWKYLEQQLGATYTRQRDFQAQVLKNLVPVLQVYPQARISMDPNGNGLWISPSPPAVAPKELS